MLKRIIFFAICLDLVSAPAQAHTNLISSQPRSGSVLKVQPAYVVLNFDDNLLIIQGKEINKITVIGPRGENLSGSSTVSGSKLETKIRRSSEKGIFTVNWRVVAADGHAKSGSFKFKVS